MEILSDRVAILQLPGSNCEYETLQAVERAGGMGRIVRWNEPVDLVAGFGAYVIPGGFSYQDRIRAGAVSARLPLLRVIRERAAEGAPVLGICNGAQVLVEAGLVPGIEGERLEMVLAPNRMPGRDGYYTRWVYLGEGPASERCLFTRGLGGKLLPIPIAHAEGRFWTRDETVRGRLSDHIALTYRAPDRSLADSFPWNPNGSLESAAGITNRAGNVLAMMPHPERALQRGQVPEPLLGGPRGDPDSEGPGVSVFHALVKAVGR